MWRDGPRFSKMVSGSVWFNCLAVWDISIFFAAWQVLKIAQWDAFFTETHQLVCKHLSEEPGFFTTLAQLLLGKLVRSVNVTKAITADSVAFLKGFCEQLFQHHALTGSGSVHEETLKSVAALVNFGSAPGLSVDSVVDFTFNLQRSTLKLSWLSSLTSVQV